MSDLLYFYNESWYTYEDLHNSFGISYLPAQPVTMYDLQLNQKPGWATSSEFWSSTDNMWYSFSSIPYYQKLNSTIDVYLIDNLLTLAEYSKNGVSLYEYSSHLRDLNYLHSHFGITTTPSMPYYAIGGVIKCWYNDADHKYWDASDKLWLDSPPDYASEDIDTSHINNIGATAQFIFTNGAKNYGDVVPASQLQPINMNFSTSGLLSYTKLKNLTITGTWRLMTSVQNASIDNPSIVLARKISEDESLSTTLVEPTTDFIETTFYNL